MSSYTLVNPTKSRSVQRRRTELLGALSVVRALSSAMAKFVTLLALPLLTFLAEIGTFLHATHSSSPEAQGQRACHHLAALLLCAIALLVFFKSYSLFHM